MSHQLQPKPKLDFNSICIYESSSALQTNQESKPATPTSHSPQEQSNKYAKYQNLIHHPEIWRMVINRNDHDFGKNGYENERFYSYDDKKDRLIPEPTVTYEDKKYISHKGEPGYMAGMLDSLKEMLNMLGESMCAEKYLKFHELSISKIDGIKSGFRKECQVYFPLDFSKSGNASYEGFCEWDQKRDSIWESDKLTILKGKENIDDPGIYKLSQNDNPTSEDESSRLVFFANAFDNPDTPCNTVFNEYYKMMECLKRTGTFPGCKNEGASLEDKKLEIIARICQNLDQMHLFYDGNIRTIGFLLLNKFLIENDLSPTIMDDPNMIDLKSIQEIIYEIKKGQDYFQKTFFPTQK